jgi:hypothetical protein
MEHPTPDIDAPVLAASRVVGDSIRTQPVKHHSGRKRTILPMDDVVAAYKTGRSESAIAREYGVARGTIGRRLEEIGAKGAIATAPEVQERLLPGRRMGRHRPSLVASATRINLADRSVIKQVRARRQGWQSEAWDYSDEVPEVNYAINYVANLMAKVRIFPAIQINPDEPPVPVDSDEAKAIIGSDVADLAIETLARLKALQGGQAAILRDLSTNFDVCGEAYLHGHIESADADWDTLDEGLSDADESIGDEDWQVRSIDELVVVGDTFALRTGASTQSTVPIPIDDLCLRLWARHPRFSFLATSPMRSILGSCETMLLLEAEQRAHAKSQLNPGALIVPTEASFGPIDPTRDQSDGEEGDDPLNDELNTWFVTPVQEPGSAASVAPGLMRPAREDAPLIRWMDMTRPDNQFLDQRIENLVMRIARGLNLNVEIVTGLAATTFSNAAQIWRSVFEDHIQPRCILICDCITAGFLQWQLMEAKVDKDTARKIFVWFDPTEVLVQDDQAEAAQAAHKDMLISDSAVRRLLGYSEDDAPTPDEILLRLMINSPRMDPFLFGQLLKRTGLFPEIRIPGPQGGVLDELHSVSEAPAPGAGGDAPATQTNGNTGSPVTASAAPRSDAAKWKALGPKLAGIDRDLRTKILGALDLAMANALQRAGNKIKSKVNGSKKTTEAAVLASVSDPALYAAALGAPILTAAGLTSDALVGDGFDQVLTDLRSWIDAAYDRAVTQVSTVANISAAKRTELDTSHKSNTDRALDFLRFNLVGIAAKRLYDPSPAADMRGESDPTARVPVGLVRAALAIAGGTTPQVRTLTAGASQDPSEGVWMDVGSIVDASGDPVGGIATGPDMAGVVSDAGGRTEGYVWVYGASVRSFQPHLDIDGTFATDFFSDETWANSEGWPADYCFPGDHDGCQCSADAVWIGLDGEVNVDLG